jgi:hypothetical protein
MILEERMVTAFETSVDLLARSEERKERMGKDQESAELERVSLWRVHDFRGEDVLVLRLTTDVDCDIHQGGSV